MLRVPPLPRAARGYVIHSHCGTATAADPALLVAPLRMVPNATPFQLYSGSLLALVTAVPLRWLDVVSVVGRQWVGLGAPSMLALCPFGVAFGLWLGPGCWSPGSASVGWLFG
jgi:hypothetical protein